MNGTRRLGILLWMLYTTYTATSAQTKYLFTVPQNLWQGSLEEFCISFHDDDSAKTDYMYDVSISMNDEVYQLGNGTTNGESRVCHHFSVPGINGRGTLSLRTSATKELAEDVFTTVDKTDSSEVTIHETSLQTFIQTDKPIYKPGETVKFRAMTVNRDLKPWTGMVPLVTIQNPSDVRVMQWKNEENKKGLLSFEMPLSEDPTLGEWQISMIVEGKKHDQTFTVQEYVLPKYEVTLTAPSFLLPTTENIEGTVCAKYTYGKPVKGRVELSVCYEDASPYYYYYRYEQEERPCATRIIDINGCETFSVDGSELDLKSSNYSRYGNLVINATVTEQATGISLNGTVKGPEMTFEAVKMKFEDDTHGYFKEAFPYYARVVVTNPDGSPAPGELVEISADNYDPEFHLKRNFTSDENGIVKFAIKNLPKNVNRLSFGARAPKYHSPYGGRYYYVVRMYEPRANHYANKWYSPSNSYIHLPAVEGQLKCGSVAEFDILYSTPPDTRYKFFVQVLSKSHMVHHTHVKHHFKIHDAVNFDGIPDEMLLDPFTPPPRPTYYYPIEPIPYDDPELGYKPPADNVTIKISDLLPENGTSTTNESDESSEEKETCNLLAVLGCAQPMREVGQQTVEKMCMAFETFQKCIEPHVDNCKDESSFQGIASMEDTYKTMCKNTDCDVMELAKCMQPMAYVSQANQTVDGICQTYEELIDCVAPFREGCKSSDMFNTVGVVMETYHMICSDTDKEEEEDSNKICEDLYRLHKNTTVKVSGSDAVTGTSTRQVSGCAQACNDDNTCQGFLYEDSTTCILLSNSYATEESEGIDYYERNCYRERSRETVISTHVGKIRISVPITANMGPESQLLVYYVREDDETIAASLTFKVERCFDNKVEMKFNRETVYPGNDVKVNVKASPGSLCSVGVVDKSINLLAGNKQLTPEMIFGRFKTPYMYTSYWKDDRKYCDEKTHYDEDLNNPADYYSNWNFRQYETDAVDAVQAFRDMKLIVFTDLTLQTRPCKVLTRRPVYYSPLPFNTLEAGSPGGGVRRKQIALPALDADGVTVENEIPESKPRETRSLFPETWLWDLHMIGDEGEVSVDTTIPHTITEWVGNSLCTHLEDGVGVSPMTGITAFQPFFLSFTLPYSAIRGEIVPVLVTIFNYMSECLVMQVSLPNSDDFGLERHKGSERHVLRCVCPGETSTVKYYVVPYTLGKIKILATAESIPDDGTCGNKAVSMDGTGANDAVERELLIEAEGIEKEYTVTSYLCPEGSVIEEKMELLLPSDNLVDDSARGYINVIGDIMGPALSNLNDLLRMPYGCGEQNMASFSPNIFALQYLTNTNQLLPKIEEEAKGYMRIGYQRQLKYRHSDGSYSAFGGEGSGSIWLTAFVIKCLGQSRPYISVDDNDLEKSVAWFKRQQLENGCFPKIGYTHSYYLKGGFSDRSNEASLTAFVLIAMLEAGIPPTDESVVKAVRCLDVQTIPDTYTLSLMAYAYTLYDVRHLRRQHVMKMLEDRATIQDGMKFWARTQTEDDKEKKKWYYTAVSAEVEMTAYALLAHITGEQQNAVLDARPLVMWLTKQRNPRGGFSSTQDTIVALQALARYATLVYQGGVNVSVAMMEKDNVGSPTISQFDIDDDNTLVLQSSPIKSLPSTLEAKVGGVGCAMIQANVKYNMYETPTSPSFVMNVKVYRAKTESSHCAKRTLSICVRYTGPGGVSNMAIVDVKMVTGWVPVKDSLEKLLVQKLNPAYVGIEKYELDGNYVHIYFDQLDNQQRCFLMDVEQDIELSNPKPAQVKVYDYYETDFTLIVNYKIKTICGTKEELPYISPEEYYSGIFVDIPVDEIVQVRIPSPVLDNFRPQRPSCPVCYNTFDTKSALFRSLVCGSDKIYKVQTGRNGRFSLKVYADVRQKKKEKVNLFVQKNFDNCSCDLLDGKKGKILVFSEKDTLDKSERSLALNSSTKIIKLSKSLEKAVYRLVRRKC